MTSESPPGLRERTRRAVRSELMAEAMNLFAAQGYDATTIDQIASAAGLSKRSFFRYFASKEDVILVNFEAFGQALAAALADRPAGESAWVALRRAFDLIVERNDSDPARTLVLLRMLHDTPALKAAHLEKQSRWRELLVPHVVARLPAKTGPGAPRAASAASGEPGAPGEPEWQDMRPAAVVGAALACLDAAQTAWCAAGGRTPLAGLLDDAMDAVGPLDR